MTTITPRPPHRWKSLWFSLLSLAFLCWAWHASYRHDSGLSWGNVIKFLSIHSSYGDITLRKIQDISGSGLPSGPGVRGFATFSHPIKPEKTPTPPPIRILREDLDSLFHLHSISIAWWFITLLYLIAITGLLLWRRHRQHPLTSPGAPASAGTDAPH